MPKENTVDKQMMLKPGAISLRCSSTGRSLLDGD